MLDVFRAGKSSLISWFFLAALIAVFAFVGPGSSAWSNRGGTGCAGAGTAYAAKVNGQTISLRDYQEMETRVSAYLTDRFLRQLATPEAMQDPTRLNELRRQAEEIAGQSAPSMALEQIVQRELVLQDAQRRGLEVSTTALDKAIATDPRFQQDGKFSLEQYKAVAGRYGSQAALDESIRKQLLYEAATGAVEATAKVPESEVHDTWKKNADEVGLTLVLFSKAAARAASSPTDAEVTAFVAKDAARIEKFYADNAARYDQPKQVRVRHLLFKIDGKDGKDGARKRAAAALARLEKGEDFAKLAAEVSEDANTKQAGGDLGVIRQGLVEDAVAKAALALDKGKLSAPVESPTGFHVLRVDEVIPAKKTPLAEVKQDIARELLADDKQNALLQEKADAALAAVRAGKPLHTLFPAPPQPAKPGEKVDDKNVVKLGDQPVVAQDVGPFPVSTNLTMLGTELMKDAVAAKAGDVLPKVYSVPQGLVVGVVKERNRPDEAKFAKERDGVLSSLRRAKAEAVQKAYVETLRAGAKVVENTAYLTGGQRGVPLPLDE